MKKICVLLVFVALAINVNAQFGYGFKTGLNFNNIQTDDLREGEEYDSNTGFHIGAIFGYAFTDLMGVRGELLYSIKGGRLRYNGDGVFGATADSGREFVVVGNRSSTLRVGNSYLEIPITFYAKPLEWLELSVGAEAAILINSTGVGQLIVNGETMTNGQTFAVDEFDFDLNYDYRKDKFDSETTGSEVVEFAGEEVTLPSSIGAYYEYPEDFGKKFNTLDFGLVGGASFYLNDGLFVGLRACYGLTDITNNEADRVITLNEAGTGVEAVVQDHIDTNLTLQASVGFIF